MKTTELNELVRKRFSPPDWGLLANVSDGAGNRYCDWLAMGLWQSRGWKLVGIECKVSRSDWLRELKRPGKAEPIFDYCDEWYLIVGDAKVCKPEELPEGWGLMVPDERDSNILKTIVKPKKLKPKSVDRRFLAAMFRRVCEHGLDTETLRDIEREAERKAREWHLTLDRNDVKRAEAALEKRDALIDQLKDLSGVHLESWTLRPVAECLKKHYGQIAVERVDDKISEARRLIERLVGGLQATLANLKEGNDEHQEML